VTIERVLCAGTTQATPLLYRLAPARAAGFTAITIFAADLEKAREQGLSLAEIRAAVAAAGLRITEVETICHWLPGQRPSAGGFPDWLMRATPEAMCAAAVELGARTVGLVEAFGAPFDGPVMARHFGRACDIATEHGLAVGLECLPTGGIPDLASAWEIVRRADRPNGGLIIDSWHMTRSNSPMAALAAIPGERIVSIQLNDGPAEPEADLAQAMMTARRLPGEGAFDLAGMMRALAASGTRAPIGIEVFSMALDALPIAEVARRCAAALDYCLTGDLK
jgi:sugar phosphate isomerase/epimerase